MSQRFSQATKLDCGSKSPLRQLNVGDLQSGVAHVSVVETPISTEVKLDILPSIDRSREKFLDAHVKQLVEADFFQRSEAASVHFIPPIIIIDKT